MEETKSLVLVGSMMIAALFIISFRLPFSDAITGQPEAIASRTGKPNPSSRDG